LHQGFSEIVEQILRERREDDAMAQSGHADGWHEADIALFRLESSSDPNLHSLANSLM
jgi:hypothetical protein